MAIYMVDLGTTADANVAQGKYFASARFDRRLVGVALAGSVAVNDCEAGIYFEDQLVARIGNSSTDDVPNVEEMKYINNRYVLRAGQQLRVIAETQSQLGVATVVLKMRKVKRPSRRGGRGVYRRRR